ncbi:MAG: peptide chain release factor N(5)-glutamine methyltransferase [Saprospiraceae bacterium]
MNKQELCQKLSIALSGYHNDMEINNIANYIIAYLPLEKASMADVKGVLYDTDFFNNLIVRLKSNEPIQYILNQACFMGLDFYVNSHVLIPRSETEELVAWILEIYKKDTILKVLDIGTGSGCIAISLKKFRPHWDLTAIDYSNEAIGIAHKNSAYYGINIKLIYLDFMKHASQLKSNYDLIVSNPPYIDKSELHLVSKSVLDFEPTQALFPESDDPLIFYREIARFSMKSLNDKGSIFLEINEYYEMEIKNIFIEYGFSAVTLRNDLQNKPRMLRIQF